MSFEVLDAALPEWLTRHGLHVLMKGREGEDVRVVPIVDDAGDRYSIWFVQEAGLLAIYAEDYPVRWADHQRWSQTFDPADLPRGLEEAYYAVETWILVREHTRTPYLAA